MSNNTPNNSLSEFFQRHQRWIAYGAAVFGFINGLVGFIKLAQGNAGLVTKVSLTLGIIILWLLCAYIYWYWKPTLSSLSLVGVPSPKLSKRYRILRCLALAGIIAIPILTAIGGYVWHNLPTKDTIVLLADFESSGKEQKNYDVTVTQDIFDKFDNYTRNYSDIKIQRLNKAITRYEDALKEGKKHKATIVIWGRYNATKQGVQLKANFEVLRSMKYLLKINRLERVANVSELENFTMQTKLSEQMLYLSLFTVGLTHYTTNDFDKAITSFTNALKNLLDPTPTQDKSIIYLFRGSSYTYKGKHDSAINDYDQAIKLNPNCASAYNNQSAIYHENGEHDSTTNNYNQAIKLNNICAITYHNRGVSYHEHGKADSAIQDYNKATKLNPKFAEPYNSLGAFYLEKGNCKSAIDNFTKSIRLDRNFANAYNNRGICYLVNGEYDQAFKDFTQAIKLNPNYSTAYYNRGDYYFENGEYDSAINDLTQAIKLNPNYLAAYSNRGLCYLKKGEYDRAINDFTQAIKLKKSFAQAYYGRGIAYKKKGSKDKAVENFKNVLKLNNDKEYRQKAEKKLQELGTK